ncbi:hypothetical protein Bca52824_080280 [Brassica carinata]|uniref:Uncharacterized protein n=1 Tax=Brassica carinata TaxID=52824 RepID=A0A8X7PD13_BRACI|nr:hypothetical protein Bca52824_080280 [Brassica carinata]
MAPKTRFAGKTNKEGAPKKKKKNRSAAEKKKAAAVKRRREAVKKKEMQQRRRLKPQKRRGSKTRLRRSLHPIQPSGVGPHLQQNNIPIPIIPRHHQRNCFLRMIERVRQAHHFRLSHKKHLLKHPVRRRIHCKLQ